MSKVFLVENFRAVRSLSHIICAPFLWMVPRYFLRKNSSGSCFRGKYGQPYHGTAVYTAVLITYSCTASAGNDGAGAVDCDSHRAVGHFRTIRGVF